MKTTKIRLIATMITLAAAITITAVPAEAQRREDRGRDKSKVTSTRSRTASSTRAKKMETKSRSTAYKKPVQKSTKSSDLARTNRSSDNRYRSSSQNNSRNDRGERIATNRAKENNKTYTQRRNERQGKDVNSSRNHTYKPESRSDRGSSEMNRRDGKYDSRRHAGNDRYTPSKDYRGSNKYWSHKRPNNKSYRHHNNWDRSWQNYKWNRNSWRDYYGRYDFYSYKHHKHYYYHRDFGHVIRRFITSPVIFYHNNHRYYCHDGHFFKYRRGVGYVLVEIPFGLVFNQLPYDYEVVYINGYMYFRVGNLFFERNWDGYRLVHYPERYFSFNDNYYLEEYYR